MSLIRISAVSCTVMLALIRTAVAKPMHVAVSRVISPHAQVERIYYRCPGQWVPDGTIAAPTGGYPYYGWYGYPYVPYRCVRVHRGHFRYYRQPIQYYDP